METKTQQQILSEIYSETLESLIRNKINLELYKQLDPDENVIPQELVASGVRSPKTAGQRMNEIKELVDTSERTLLIINTMKENV